MFWLEPAIDINFFLAIIFNYILKRILKNFIHFETQNLEIKI
jgi:hypothetical protein